MALAISWLGVVSPVGVLAAGDDADGIKFFEQKIRPILVEHCYACHSVESKKSEGGLLLDSRASLRKGGDSGPAIVPHNPDQSLLITAVRHEDKDLKMPPEGKLSAVQLTDLAAWVKRGAPDPREAIAGDLPVASKKKYGIGLEEGRRFWSLQPVVDPALPRVRDTTWPTSSLDYFILAKLEAANLTPAARADKRTLLRRVTFDLTGLPPSSAELTTFLADDSPLAFERVVDRLLDSPRYGERWGRHWLDVVRYADTCGNASDYPIPQAHKYRDWVIRAINRDLPYDQFLQEQIAGDLLPSTNDAERNERIVATGYLAIARRFGGGRGEPHLTIEDTIDNLGRAILGSTISCARCHDHKFDPFTSNDYYGLYGIFNSTRYPFPGGEGRTRQEDFVPLVPPAEIEALLKPHRAQVAEAEAIVKQREADEVTAKKLPENPEKAAQVAEAAKATLAAKQQLAAVQAAAPQINDAYAVAEGTPAHAKIQLRGDPKRLGDEVPRHFPAVLGGQELASGQNRSGRLELAQWLTERANPLTARVLVNRVWQHHFGLGLVQTPNDFGRQGKPPTHPELLDHLASRFMAEGWSLKALHKTILLSQAWQQSSAVASAQLALDPSNELVGHYSRRRLDAEAIRDTLLYVSGELDESQAGAHPFPPTATFKYTQHRPFAAAYDTRQRSVYLMQSRLRKHAYLALFDGPDPSSSTGVRLPSTTPLQALFFMNDPLAHLAANSFAARVIASSPDDAARIEFAYRAALSRPATAEEISECQAFLTQYREQLRGASAASAQHESAAWSALARAMLSSNEFLFVD